MDAVFYVFELDFEIECSVSMLLEGKGVLVCWDEFE